MAKQSVSVTLDTDNLVWLKGRADAAGLRSVSELIDRIVRDARAAGTGVPARSVVGTVDIAGDDPGLEQADAAVRVLFDRSLGRPMAVKETPPPHGRAGKAPRQKRRG